MTRKNQENFYKIKLFSRIIHLNSVLITFENTNCTKLNYRMHIACTLYVIFNVESYYVFQNFLHFSTKIVDLITFSAQKLRRNIFKTSHRFVIRGHKSEAKLLCKFWCLSLLKKHTNSRIREFPKLSFLPSISVRNYQVRFKSTHNLKKRLR